MFAISQYQCGLANIRNPINLVRTVVICNLQTLGEKMLKDVEFRLDKLHVMTFRGVLLDNNCDTQVTCLPKSNQQISKVKVI